MLPGGKKSPPELTTTKETTTMTNTTIYSSRSTLAAWKNYTNRQTARHDAMLNRRLFGEVNYTTIIDVAEDYLFYCDKLYTLRVKHGFRKNDNVWLPSYPDIARAYDQQNAAYEKLSTICELTHTNINAAIKAAKVRWHNYNRGLGLYDIICDVDYCGKALQQMA